MTRFKSALALTCAALVLVAVPGGSGSAGATEQGCVATSTHGSGGTAFRLFWPACGEPHGPLPLVVFLHGFSAIDPVAYGAWIDDIVRSGAVVVYPVYQTSLLDLYQTDNAIASVQLALVELRNGPYPPIDTDRVVYAGHSAGGGLSLNLAAESARGVLPKPWAVMAVEPANNLDPAAPGEPDAHGWVRDWRSIPASTRLVIVVGDQDTIVNDEAAYLAWERTTQVSERRYVTLRSRTDRFPPLLASHLTPLSPPGVWLPPLFEVNDHDRWLWSTLDHFVHCDRGECLPETGQEPLAGITDVEAPPRQEPNPGNQISYEIYRMVEAIRPLCAKLHLSVCGAPPYISPAWS